MPHLIARHPDGYHVPLNHPEAVVEQVSGELREVRMWNDTDRNNHMHQAIDYVPVEHVDDYVARAYSNAHRDTATGDRAWDHVEVGTVHADGPGGPNQHWHDDVPADLTVTVTHPAADLEGVNA